MCQDLDSDQGLGQASDEGHTGLRFGWSRLRIGVAARRRGPVERCQLCVRCIPRIPDVQLGLQIGSGKHK